MNSQHTYVAMAVILVYVFAHTVQAADRTWNCQDDYWDDTACWNPSGMPLNTEDILLTTVGGADTYLTIDSITGSAEAGNLDIAATAGTTVTLSQSGGTLSVGSDLTLGFISLGYTNYGLSSGALLVGNNEYIGHTDSSSFYQWSTSTHTVTNSLVLGFTTTGDGVYNQSGGGLSAGYVYIGYAGTGAFTQSGGTNSVTNDLVLGTEVTSNGTYDLSGAGALTADYEYIGLVGTGAFTQSGGTNDVAFDLVLGSQSTGNGNYLLNNGTLSALNVYIGSSGTGTLIQNGGGIASVAGYLGHHPGSSGSATVDGAGSTWANTGDLHVGYDGTGTLNILNGGTVSNDYGSLGGSPGSSGSVTVVGAGSTWENMSQLNIGISGEGTLSIQNGGSVSNTLGSIGGNPDGNGSAVVDGSGSTWTSTSLSVGHFGTGTLNILNGGFVSNDNGYLGYFPGSSGKVTVDGVGSAWTNNLDLFVGDYGTGTLDILNGGTVFDIVGRIGAAFGSSGTATVDGAGSTWTNEDVLIVGETGSGDLTIRNAGTVISYNGGSLGYVAGGSGTATVEGAGSTWTNNYWLNVGDSGTGDLTIRNGGAVSSLWGQLGVDPGSSGSATVDGAGSAWDTGSYGFIVGIKGTGTLDIRNGGTLSSGTGAIGLDASGIGTATVDGAGSAWVSNNELVVGSDGTGTLDIRNGGTVSNDYIGYIGSRTGSTGTVTVGGAGSRWTNNEVLFVGGNIGGAGGSGTLNVETGGLVEIGSTLTVWGTGMLNLNGGTVNMGSLAGTGNLNFNAGTLGFSNNLLLDAGSLLGTTLSLNAFKRLNVSGTTTLAGFNTLSLEGGTFTTGSLINNGGFVFNSGTFNLTGDNLTVGSDGLFGDRLTIAQKQSINVSNSTIIDSGAVLEMTGGTLGGGNVSNSGELAGDGRINAPLYNQPTGEVRVGTGESLRLTAAGNLNNGRIEVIGGELEFDQDLTNQAGSIVARNAILRFSGGLANQGSLGLSFGISDLFGDISNDGFIVQSGGGQVTFFDDVINNGTIQTSAGSQAVFFGAVSGNGSFPGAGTVFFEGDLMPGSSPGLVSVGGDMGLGVSARTIMEIAGLERGTGYDAFDIGGDLWLDGVLEVALYDSGSDLFTPHLGDSFDLFLADTITGDFDMLVLAALGDGLDWHLDMLADAIGMTDVVRLSVVATSVPLPPSAWLLGAGLLGLIGVARRRAA